MELNINKDEAQLIHCALIYYLQRGATYWYKDVYPKADLTDATAHWSDKGGNRK